MPATLTASPSPLATSAPSGPAAPGLDAQQLRSLHEDGYLILRDVMPHAARRGLLRRYAEHGDRIVTELRKAGAPVIDADGEPDERRFAVATRDCQAELKQYGRGWRRDIACGAIYDLQTTPRLVDAIAATVGPAVYGHGIFNARPKLPGQELTTVPWHQDGGYFGPQSAKQRIITAWIPLVPVDAHNGCLQIAIGSHRYGLFPHHTDGGDGGFLELTGGDPRPDMIATCVMAPGDVVIFDQLTWHRSLPHTGEGVRWSIDLRYYGTTDVHGAAEFPAPWVIRHPEATPVAREEWVRWAEQLRW